jgi:hypothetical protein
VEAVPSGLSPTPPRKKVLFLIPVCIVQVTKFVEFT